ncbi:chromate efflux transporter [Nesterenkonia sp. MY13]|uniref:Chromate efflux transporter n=1 Tax=Nesterenkonia sedimenti TaxID=1463632 RepID=A0A7X8TH19_9MICC|nr:chromate efflux transporter [Nesterenkonia sedimenti]NLS08594.1 chromate efflux transporter [Nesterenkonia sedimenti]
MSEKSQKGSVWEVFWIFLRLGLTSFGGPVAHLAYFREAFVQRRKWLTEKAYADLVALCQFLPGPASSQVGMALGLQRAGWGGLFAAWFAFTMPSVILLVAFAYGVATAGDLADAGWIHGLKAAAVAVVAHAVLGMAKSMTPDAPRATIAAMAAIIVLLVPEPLILVAAIAVSGVIGLIWLKPESQEQDPADAYPVRIPKAVAFGCIAAFFALLAGLPLLATLVNTEATSLADTFYRSGALVFGGGHVVLPLLEAETVQTGMVDSNAFLAGYGAAQAVPGPLFTFSGFLGAAAFEGPMGLVAAGIAILAIFLPGALLVIGCISFWEQLRSNFTARKALLGFNAGVVGILAAAFYDPVFTAGVIDVGIEALAVAIACFIALVHWKVPAWAVVIGAGLLGAVIL